LRRLAHGVIGTTCWIAIASICLAAGVFMNRVALAGQPTVYVTVPPVSTPNPEAFMKAQLPATCRDNNNIVTDYSLPDGSYVRAAAPGQNGTWVILDATTGSVSGHCNSYTFGVFTGSTYRYINAIGIRIYPPSALPSYSPRWGPWPPPQTDP
jgi:hypothetical protein